MLKFMRTHAASWFIKIIIGAIVVVFVLYFGKTGEERKKLAVATVEDTSITKKEFDRVYRNLFENYKKIFGQQLTPDLLKGLDIKQQVLDQLIDAAVIQQWCKNIGLRVTEEELRQIILQNPAFQRGGQFDRYLYEQFLRGIGYDNETFLVQMQRELLNQRLGNIIGDTAVILTEEEVKELYFLENGKINLSFVKVSPHAFAKRVTVTQGELERYYADHKEEYRAPSVVKVIYLRFSPDEYRKEVKVSPQEVQEYYDINKVEYIQEGKKKRLDEVKGEIVSVLSKEKAKDLAAIHAEDAAYQAKKKGGLKPYANEAGLQVREGGPFKAGESLKGLGVKEKLSSIAFTLDVNEISSAFKDGDDYFVLQVVDKIPPQVLSLERVREQIKEALVSSLAQKLAQGTAQELLTAWRKGAGFLELLRRYGLNVDETGFFKRSSSSPPGIGPLGAYAGKIASLTLEAPWPEDIAEMKDAFVVIKLQGVEKIDEKGYEKENDAYRKRLYSYKGRQFLQGWLAAMKKKADITINQELLGEYR